MSDDFGEFTRRKFLEVGSAVVLAAAAEGV
jgi:hypothetical protein